MNKPLSKESVDALARGFADVKAGRVAPAPHDVLTARGHVWEMLGRKSGYCRNCKAKKPPRGGVVQPCPADARHFIGDGDA